MRVFLDSSVLFSAAYSATGASREILEQAIDEKITVVISKYVLEEVERSLQSQLKASAPLYLATFSKLRELVPFEIVNPTKRQTNSAVRYTHPGDAHIVAAAKRAGVDYLVSLDRKHLVEAPEVSKKSGLAIILPGTFLERLRSTG